MSFLSVVRLPPTHNDNGFNELSSTWFPLGIVQCLGEWLLGFQCGGKQAERSRHREHPARWHCKGRSEQDEAVQSSARGLIASIISRICSVCRSCVASRGICRHIFVAMLLLLRDPSVATAAAAAASVGRRAFSATLRYPILPHSKEKLEAKRERPIRNWKSMNAPALVPKFLRHADRVARELGVADEIRAFDEAAASFPNPCPLVANT